MILADTAEPETIIRLLRQAVPVTVSPLNLNKIADYFFGNYEGKKFQFGRVQAGELVGDIDSMEDELRRYYNSADETFQIIEGLLSPVKLFMKSGSAEVSNHSQQGRRGEGLRSIGGVGLSSSSKEGSSSASLVVSTRDLSAKMFCYQVEPSGFIKHGRSFNTVRMAELYAWIHRLNQVGVSTYYTNNWEETARLLITIFRNEQKAPEDHTTFKRVYRPRITIKEADPFMKSLLFLSSAYQLGIGEVKAKALCDRFANLFDLATSPVEEIAECEKIGSKMAENILRALGRE